MKEGKRLEFKLTRHTVTLFLVTMLTFTLAFEDNFVVRGVSILAFIVFVMGSFFLRLCPLYQERPVIWPLLLGSLGVLTILNAGAIIYTRNSMEMLAIAGMELCFVEFMLIAELLYWAIIYWRFKQKPADGEEKVDVIK